MSMAKGGRPRPGSAIGAAVARALKLVWWAIVICLPALGAWLASSLAAYDNRPPWVAALAGLALFPVVPLLWEGYAAFRRRGPKAKRFLTLGDRLLLRTLALSLAFLGVTLAAFPRRAFLALTVRGDWALDGRAGEGAERARRALFATAERLAWLYEWANEKNPYDDRGQRPGPEPPGGREAPVPSAAESAAATVVPSAGAPAPAPTAPPAAASASAAPRPVASASATPGAAATAGRRAADPAGDAPRAAPPVWPLPDALHPLVASLPPEHETSPASVARYLAERERDPVLLVKALHDYVADRVAYDAPAYLAGDIPDQSAAKVFAERKGVCEGYARLFAELGRHAGVEVAFVVGDARGIGGDVSGLGHAWNAVRLGGAWHLVDVTWDAGGLKGDAFEKNYRSDYLLTPPHVFGLTHLPSESRWQLRPDPLSRGEFLRQPNLRPSFFALGFALAEPERSQITVERSFGARISNPQGASLIAAANDKRGGAETRCKVSGDRELSVRCDLPAEGTYHVRFFTARERGAVPHAFAGQVEVNRGP
jgi:transglutaminase-like putative cysteine protease